MHSVVHGMRHICRRRGGTFVHLLIDMENAWHAIEPFLERMEHGFGDLELHGSWMLLDGKGIL